MKTVTFQDVGRLSVEEIPDPTIAEPGDAVLRVTTTAICGSDLHVLHGRIPGMMPGSVIGHEFIGTVEAVGGEVSGFREGDRALASFMIPCGRCWYCGNRWFNRCPDQRVFGYGVFLGESTAGRRSTSASPTPTSACTRSRPR